MKTRRDHESPEIDRDLAQGNVYRRDMFFSDFPPIPKKTKRPKRARQKNRNLRYICLYCKRELSQQELDRGFAICSRCQGHRKKENWPKPNGGRELWIPMSRDMSLY